MLFNVWTLPNDQGQRAKRETKPNNAFVFSLLVWRRVGFEARVGCPSLQTTSQGRGERPHSVIITLCVREATAESPQ
jgi:hypothetical protein